MSAGTGSGGLELKDMALPKWAHVPWPLGGPVARCLEMPSHYLGPGCLRYALARFFPALMGVKAFRSVLWPEVVAALDAHVRGQSDELAKLILAVPQLLNEAEVREPLVESLEHREFELIKLLWKYRRKKPRQRASVELHQKALVWRGAAAEDPVRAAARFMIDDGEYRPCEPSQKQDYLIAELARGEGASSDEIMNKAGKYTRVKSTLRHLDAVTVIVPAAIVPCDRHPEATRPETAEVRDEIWNTGKTRIPSAEEASAAEILSLRIFTRERIVLCPEGVTHVVVEPGRIVAAMTGADASDASLRFLKNGGYGLTEGHWDVTVKDGVITGHAPHAPRR